MNRAAPDVRRATTSLRTRIGLRGVIVAGALFFTYAFFYQGGGWNQNARFDLVRAIVEEHTLRIDDYHSNTGDKALVDGHYYSDKAPGVSFVAVPPVAVARPVLDAVGIDSASTTGLTALSYLATLLVAAVPTALAAFGIYWLAQRLGASSAGATFAAVAFGLATPMWAYATLFWGHAITAALLFGGFAAAVCLRDRASPRRDQLLGGLLGVAVGWATVSDYTSAVPAVLIAGLGVKHVWDRAAAPRARIMAAMAGGALACGMVLIVHNVLAFGSPFELGYSQTVNFPGMSQGLFGVQTPDLGVLRELVLGRYRGLLLLAPIVIAAPIGLFLLAKKRELRAAVVVAGCIPVYFLLVNAGYATWDGGWTYGPRFLAPALPFLCLPLAAVWTRARHLLRVPLLAVLLWGAALSLVAVSTTAQPPDFYKSPVTELLWPSFRDGRFPVTAFEAGSGGASLRPVQDEKDDGPWNFGEKVGLAGHASIAPVFLFWLAAAIGWWLAGRNAAQREQHSLSAFNARPVPGQRATRARAAQPGFRTGGP
jgi:hypothetical protein